MVYRTVLSFVLLLLAVLQCDVCWPQTTARDRVARRSDLVMNEHVDVHWVGDDDRYAWYEADRPEGKTELVVVDMTTGQRLEAKDFPVGIPKLLPDGLLPATELAGLQQIEASQSGGRDTEIEFINRINEDLELIWVDTEQKRHSYGVIPKGESRKQHTYANHVWIVTDRRGNVLAATKSPMRMVATFTVTSEIVRQWQQQPDAEEKQKTKQPAPSHPQVFIRDFNLWLRDAETKVVSALTDDGNSQNGYDGPIYWSPTGEHFCVMYTKFAPVRMITLLDSAPDGQLQAQPITHRYVKPGDELDVPQLRVFERQGKNVANQQAVTVGQVTGDKFRRLFGGNHPGLDLANAINPFEVRDVSWRPDGTAVRFVTNERGHQHLLVQEFNVHDGKLHRLVTESSDTFIDYAGKYYLHFLDGTDELIWMSERSGWNHLYLTRKILVSMRPPFTEHIVRDRSTLPITKGKWVVREVVDLDEAKRTMLISVGGMAAGEDPYYRHLVRASLDGDVPVRLTEGDGDHEWRFSPTKRYFVDQWSRVDLPPVTEIRSLVDGKLIARLEAADANDLLLQGWTMPLPFRAKGRDGTTDIYGIVVLPRNFDTTKKYPVLELIYAGPQSAYVPKSFDRLRDLHRTADGVDGKQFIVVMIDGMGTSHRSKAFHDVCWKNLGDAGFLDRIAWIKTAALPIPQMDLSRVGIWGGSAGGQSAMRALTHHGDFYKAAFADCGCHDNRMDKIWWNELWMGWPVGPHYKEQSNVTNAHLLTGKLMLSVGELDTNVDPSSTLQVVDALIKANKDFELLYFPGAGHGVGSGEYGTRRRIDFFRRALYGQVPSGVPQE